jgi:peptide/nickel transport system permease protein
MTYLLRRIVYALPILLGVALLCFSLVHIAPGDPLVSVLPPDARRPAAQLTALYGFDKPSRAIPHWLWRALHGDLGTSIATNRPVMAEVSRRSST